MTHFWLPEWLGDTPEWARLLLGTQTGSFIAEKQREALEWMNKDNLLLDTFHIDESNEGNVSKATVNTLEKSAVLRGHLNGLPIVPFVMLKKLFFQKSNHVTNRVVEAKMGNKMCLPGQTLEVRDDGIYSDGELVLGVTTWESSEHEPFDFERFHCRPEDLARTKEVCTPEELDRSLLQVVPFRFADFAKMIEVDMEEHGRIFGYFDIRRDEFYMENEILDPSIYEEIAAQVISLWLGQDERFAPGAPGWKGKLLTFRSSQVELTGKKLCLGDRSIVFAKIESLTDTEGQVSYILVNQDGGEIARGKIVGNITEVSRLERLHAIAMKKQAKK